MPDAGKPTPPEAPEEDVFQASQLDGDSIADDYTLGHALALADVEYRPMIPVDEQFRRFLDAGFSPEEAVGSLDIVFTGIPYWDFDGFDWYSLSAEEVARLYVYRELSDLPDYKIEERLKDSDIRETLGISESVTDKTIKRLANEVAARDTTPTIPTIERLIRDMDDNEIPDEYLEPPEIEADGFGVPEVVELSREMRQRAYGCINLDRDLGRSSFPKWELFKPYEYAGLTDSFLNNTKGALKNIDYYFSRDVPDPDTLWGHVEPLSRGDRRLMFLAAYEQLFNVMRDAGYAPVQPDLAVDLTDWPFYGTPGLLKDKAHRPAGVEGTKPGRNYAYSFQMATVSLTNVEVPMSLGIRAVSERKTRAYHLRRLLKYAESVVRPEFLCIDAAFYTEKVKDLLRHRSIDWIIPAGKAGSDVKERLITGAYYNDDRWNSMPYEIGKSWEDTDDEDLEHYIFVHPSQKRLNLADSGLADADNWEMFYTNVDPEEYEGGGKALHERYRLRWGVETSYRVLKDEFLIKAATDKQEKREFYVMLGFLWDAMWRAAVCKMADERGQPPKDDQGRHLFTAFQFMTAMANDFSPLDIGTITDLSEISNIVEFCSDNEI